MWNKYLYIISVYKAKYSFTIQYVKELNNSGKGDQQVLQQKMSEIIRKFDNSSSKGKMSKIAFSTLNDYEDKTFF